MQKFHQNKQNLEITEKVLINYTIFINIYYYTDIFTINFSLKIQ